MAEQRIATTKVAGSWAWFFQRLSAVLLVVLLGIHIYVDHFWHVGEDLSVSNINDRLREAVFIVIDYSLLAVVLFHGLNGTRTVLFDFDRFAKRKDLIDVGLWVLGIAMMVWGIIILWPFIQG
jgi:succinate dehydrogenase / fumarate reductase membrane anchor subunit